MTERAHERAHEQVHERAHEQVNEQGELQQSAPESAPEQASTHEGTHDEAARQARLRLAASQTHLLPSQLPQSLLPLSWMIGAWRGHGKGGYAGIEDFAFIQEVTVTTDGRPFLSYESRTWELNDEGRASRPLAVETGYIRPGIRADQPAADASAHPVEMVLCHPTGYAEVFTGVTVTTGLENAKITGAKLELHTTGALSTTSAKKYSGGDRLYGLVNGQLLWVLDMEAMGSELASHVSAQLSPLAADE
ncbi:MAG: FABP family protein [Actinomycetes bacterium]